jgi:uncharacterized protein
MNTLRIFRLGAIALASVYIAAPAAAQSAPPGMTVRPPSSPTGSISPEALQAATDLVGLTSASMLWQLTTNMTAQVWPAVEANLHSKNPKIDAATILELRYQFERLMRENITATMNDAPAIYAKYFTAQEMRDIVAFYRTPTGAKTLQVMPQATADLFALLTPRLQGLDEKVNLAFLNILQKHGYYAK